MYDSFRTANLITCPDGVIHGNFSEVGLLVACFALYFTMSSDQMGQANKIT